MVLAHKIRKIKMKVDIAEHDCSIDRINAMINAFDGVCKMRLSHHENWCVLDLQIMEGVELSLFSVHVSDSEILPKEID